MDWSQLRARRLVFEDEAILALNKPAGVSVTGERHEPTDLVRIAAEQGGERLFPVHRIDKVTSGLVVFAKQLRHHGDLTRQFAKRTVDKAYLAVTASTEALPRRGTIDLPLSVGRKNRVRIAGNRQDITREPEGDLAAATTARWWLPPAAVFRDKRGYPSVTHLARVWQDRAAERALLAVRPVTGRRHQIRVHLAWIGHPVDGDPLFRRAGDGHAVATPAARLHSWRLAFDAAWAGGARLELTAEPDDAFWPPTAPGPAGALLARAERALATLPASPTS